MIIELTGLPGAGKTTSEPWILSCLKKHHIRTISRSELRTWYIKENIFRGYENNFAARFLSNRCYQFLIYKKLFDAGLGAGIISESICKPRRGVLSWLGEDIRLSEYFLQKFPISGEPPSIYFPHEGFVHHSACFKVWGGRGFPDLQGKLLNQIPSKNFVIFYFKISVEEALDRVMTRGIPETWPAYINSSSKVKEILLRFNEAIEGAVDRFKARGVKEIEIDASVDPQLMESKVREVMETNIKIIQSNRNEKPD